MNNGAVLTGSSCSDAAERGRELEKKYRLMVKKRLNQLYNEDIGACSTKVENQALLSKLLFDESICRYRSILKKSVVGNGSD